MKLEENSNQLHITNTYTVLISNSKLFKQIPDKKYNESFELRNT